MSRGFAVSAMKSIAFKITIFNSGPFHPKFSGVCDLSDWHCLTGTNRRPAANENASAWMPFPTVTTDFDMAKIVW
jgi:hypothetical protein